MDLLGDNQIFPSWQSIFIRFFSLSLKIIGIELPGQLQFCDRSGIDKAVGRLSVGQVVETQLRKRNCMMVKLTSALLAPISCISTI